MIFAQLHLTFKIDDGLTARISKPQVCRAGKLWQRKTPQRRKAPTGVFEARSRRKAAQR